MTRNRGRGCSLARIIADVGMETFLVWKRQYREEYDVLMIDDSSKKEYVKAGIKERYYLHRWEVDSVEVRG